jgi:hypothetical protein
MGVDVGGNVLLNGEAHAYIDGACEINLPAGLVKVAISKGPEYKPIASEVVLAPGRMALRFTVEPWSDVRADRWYSGDTRAHFLSPHAALLEACAEDLAVVNLLAREFMAWGDNPRKSRAISNILAFSGQHAALEVPGQIVVVNTMNWHEELGRVLLLNCHRTVYPLKAGEAHGSNDWTLADWCDQCHRIGGLVIGNDFLGMSPGVSHGELLADLILGKVDALQMEGFDFQRANACWLKEWFGLLNCGFRVPLVGGSGKDSNLQALGSTRTYARLGPGQEFNYQNWIEAVRAGRTFVTSGPILLFTVNGQDPGAVIEVPTTAPRVQVRAEVRSLVPLERLEVLANNAVVAGIESAGSPASAIVEAEVHMPSGGWLTARCWGAYDNAMEEWVAAQASPIYVQVQGRSLPADAKAASAFLASLDKMLDWVAHEARCETDQQRERLANIFRSARQVLLDRQSV